MLLHLFLINYKVNKHSYRAGHLCNGRLFIWIFRFVHTVPLQPHPVELVRHKVDY
jgi:hypothetical protein